MPRTRPLHRTPTMPSTARWQPFWIVRRWWLAALCAACLPAALQAEPADDAPSDQRAAQESPEASASRPARDPRLDDRDRYQEELEQYEREGKLDEALESAQAMLAVELAVYGRAHIETAASYDWLARLSTQLGRFDAAREYADQFVEIMDELYGRDGWQLDEAQRRRVLVDRIAALDEDERWRYYDAERQSAALEAEGRYDEALDFARQAFNIQIQRLGENDYFTALGLRRVAELSLLTGEFEQVENQLRDSLRILERAVGEDHPEVAAALDALGAYYRARGDLETAGNYYRRAVEVRRATVGADHPYYGVALNNLAVIYDSLGEYDRAMPLYRDSLRIALARYGEEDEDVRITRDNIARVLMYQSDEAIGQDDFATAKHLLAEAVEQWTKVFGAENWRTVNSRVMLERVVRLEKFSPEELKQFREAVEQLDSAPALDDEGKTEEALAAAHRALAGFEQLFGETDRLTPQTLNEVANHLDTLGRYDEALPFYQDAERIFRRILGDEHPEVAVLMANQAFLLRNLGELAAAEKKLREVVALREKLAGKDDLDYADSLRMLGGALTERGDYAAAEPVLREALERMRPFRFEQPELYTLALYELASFYRTKGDYLQAEPLLQESLQEASRAWGEDSIDYARYTNELGALHAEQSHFAEAEPLYRRAIELLTEILGRNHVEVATCLDNLGRMYVDQGEYDRAEPLLAEALDIRRRAAGEDSEDYFESLAHVAALYRARGEHLRAAPLLIEAVELSRQVDGEDSAAYAGQLLELARLYTATEKVDLARQARLDALAAVARGLEGDDNELVARSLNSFASTLDDLATELADDEQFDDAIKARRLRREALARLFGQEHWKTTNAGLDVAELERFAGLTAAERAELARARELEDQSNAEQKQGRDREALVPASESLAIRRRILGSEDRRTLGVLESVAMIQARLAEFAAAKAALDESLAARRKLVGERHPDVVATMASIGILARKMGDYALCEEMYLARLDVDMELYGELNTETAMAMNNLGVLYEDVGRPAKALPYARRSYEIHLQLLGEENLDTINSLNTLAAVYYAMNDLERAAPIFKQVSDLYKEVLGEDHPDYIESVHTMASVLQDVDLYDLAQEFYEKALAGRERTVGKDHPDYARTLNGLALVYSGRGDYDTSARMLEEVLDVRARTLGPRHPLTAQAQSNLARQYINLGRHEDAERVFLAALDTRRATLDPESAQIGDTLYGLALLYLATDQRGKALAALEESISLNERQLEGVAAFASEPSLREFLFSIGYKLDLLLAMAAQSPDDEATVRAALTWTLRRKALVLDALCEYRAAEAIFRHDPDVAAQIAEVKRLRQEATDLALSPPAGATAEDLKKQQDDFRRQARDIEEKVRAELSRRRLAQERVEITPESVAASLPPGSALVEYIRLPTYNFKSGRDERFRLDDHYGAFVLTAGDHAPPKFVDLGPADRIDEAVAELRERIETAPRELRFASEEELEEEYVEAGSDLADLVYRPIAAALLDATTLFVAPDRELHRVPFAALVAPDGRYLIERYDIAYLTCGRDLLRTFPDSGDGTVVFAGPDYDLASPERAEKAHEMLADDSSFDVELASRSVAPEVDLRALRWNRLPGAEGEAQDVARALEKSVYAPVELFVGGDALEEAFKIKTSQSPRIVHIATHGFFLTAAEQGPDSLERGPDSSGEGEASPGSGLARLRLNANPLLRSGIVLAGANDLALGGVVAEGVEDGWLTAEEISLLDFRGTELVVLSACESGLGDIDTRDGVYGLRRSFFHAGAHSLLTSLFKVPDVETRRLMAAFYAELAGGKSKLAAVHAAQRKVLAERRSEGKAAHPFFWASFILVGEG